MRKKKQVQNQDEELISLLFKRQAELNSLLELSRAINQNADFENLLEMLQIILEAHLPIQKFKLFIQEGDGYTYLHGHKEQYQIPPLISKLLQPYQEICRVKSLPSDIANYFNQDEYYIPIIRHGLLEAFALINTANQNASLIMHDLNFMQTLLTQIIIARENKLLLKHKMERERLEHELRMGQQVQQMLIPDSFMNDDFASIEAWYQPHDSLGGDYFDFLKINRDELMWCIADVSGKGISAALLMANLQASLRAWFSITNNPQEIIKRLNELIWLNTQGERYITLFLGVYHARKKSLSYVNAGHQPSILFAKQEDKLLQKGTVMLGAFEELPFIEMGEEHLAANDLIFNFTDGLTERDHAEEVLNEQHLIGFLRPHLHLPLKEIHQNLLNQILDRSKNKTFSDDLTMLSVKVK